MIKMVVLDLDKTLLNDKGYVSDYSKNILNRCRLVGIKVIIATGRSMIATKYAIRDLIVDAIICNDGAQVYMEGYVIDIPIEKVEAKNILTKLSGDKNVRTIKISSIKGEYSSNKREIKNGVEYHFWDFNKVFVGDIYKIMLYTTSDFLPENYEKNFKCNIRNIRGGNKFMITNRDVDKNNALEAVIEKFKISKEEALAFGDDVNDKQMLEKCGVGVAMKNASCNIKQIADFVCDSNKNNGVAKWIEENLLLSRE